MRNGTRQKQLVNTKIKSEFMAKGIKEKSVFVIICKEMDPTLLDIDLVEFWAGHEIDEPFKRRLSAILEGLNFE